MLDKLFCIGFKFNECDMFAELRYGARYCDGTTLQVGVKCLCKLQSDQSVAYHCHIQEMRPDGPCLVFIEELGEKMVVNYEQLEPLPVDEIKPWAPPYRYSRANSQIVNISQVLQQIGVTILKSIHFFYLTLAVPLCLTCVNLRKKIVYILPQ